VKLLANPIFLRAALVFFCSASAFMMGLVFIRLLRRSITEEAEIASDHQPSLETLPLHLYSTVIQQLKEQKRELESQNQSEQRRARTTENLSQAVLSNLSSGVLVFDVNGLVRQSNPAAREILGFASPTGMSAADIFRLVSVDAPDNPDLVLLADEVHAVLRQAKSRRQVEAVYATPGGDERHVAVTISPVPSVDGTMLGAACMISDLSEIAGMRRAQKLHGEISSEMAQQWRTSSTSISGYAQQLANNRDPELVRQLAADIANEAALLDRSIEAFLSGKPLINEHSSALAASATGVTNK
jgi:PAS domain S-box-containing protein